MTHTTYVGTSGWVYPHWRGAFYPAEMPEADWLAYYSARLPSVEINRSFYRLPTAENFAAWRDATPSDFVFAVKANRYITHMKKLREPGQTLPPLLEAVAGLGGKLGPLLFQLPPSWTVNAARLHEFLQQLPRGVRAAFELRDPRWHRAEIFDLLARFNAAFCVYDLGGFQSARVITADFAYLRLHGPGAPYCGRYEPAALRGWARWLLHAGPQTAYVYFDNDEAGYAVRNAMELQAMLA